MYRPMPAQMAIGFVVALMLFGAAHATPVKAANDTNNVVALEALAKDAPTAGERTLARGAALALRHYDAAAIALLEPLAKGSAAKDVRDEAWSTLASVYLRQGRFAEVVKAVETSQVLRGAPLTHDEVQTMDFAKSLSGAPVMTVAHKAAGGVPVKRDMAGLMRIDIGVNGQTVDAIVDSGAGFSTLRESAAKKFGIRVIDRVTNVGSSSKEDVQTRVGIADKFQVGEAVLNNVVVAVLPDKDLTFAGGLYKVEAILGLPVFEALERIEWKQQDGKETLYYGVQPGAPAKTVAGNMILAGVQPIVLNESEMPLRLFVDTGATNTTLNASAARDFPALAAGAVKNGASSTGAGGTSTDENALTIPALHLVIAGRGFDLAKIVMHSKLEDGHHGAIGQDVLKQGTGWVFDFTTMHFAVEN
jgi:predicted aspartyl protease